MQHLIYPVVVAVGLHPVASSEISCTFSVSLCPKWLNMVSWLVRLTVHGKAYICLHYTVITEFCLVLTELTNCLLLKRIPRDLTGSVTATLKSP